jgi:hypothetical protein
VTRRLLSALLLAVVATALASPAAGAADRGYILAAEQARSYVEEGLHGRPDAARQALLALQAGTGSTQPAILADLRHDPPDYADADQRLNALVAALDRPGDVANPAQANSSLHQILSESRYSALHGQQSLWDRFWNWFFTQLLGWLATLPLGSLPGWVPWTALAVLGVLTAGVALLIARTGWTRATRSLEAAREDAPAHARDRFAEADAAAARGEWTAALRSLVAGVATNLSGQPYWESSPLTVRELFRSSGELDRLRPLLLAFERAVYGGQPLDEGEYRKLEVLAAPHRVPQQPAEAA